MKSILKGIVLVLLAASVCSALDREAFTFTKYDLELRANPDEQQIAVRGKITLRNDSKEPRKTASLQISSSLEWRMIEEDGKALQYLAEPLTSDIDHTGKVTEAVVTFANPVPQGGTVELDVGYSGAIPREATRLKKIGVPEAQALASEWDRVSADFTGVRGVGHVVWYPVAMDPANAADESLFGAVAQWQKRQARSEMKTRYCWITDEEHSFTVVANGNWEGIGGGSDAVEGARTGCSSYSYRDLDVTVPTFAMARFEMLSRPAISLWYNAGHDAAAKDYALAAEKVQPWVEAWLGETKDKVQVVELPESDDAPYESGTMLFTPLSNNRRLTEVMMAHQMAHAAFTSPRLWIREGLAQFMQAMVRERQDGRRAALMFMASRMPALQAAEKQNVANQKPMGDAAQSLVATDDEVYYRIKAMYVWWMLRDMVGDDALQAAIKSYRADMDKEPGHVQRLIAAQSKRDLEWFFDDWVYRDRGLPDFRMESAIPRETLNGANVVAVTVENLGNAAGEIPVSVGTATGGQAARLMVKAKQKDITRISVPDKATAATANDGSVPETDTTNNRIELSSTPK